MLASEINNRFKHGSSPFFSLEFYPPMKDQPTAIEEFTAMLNHFKQVNPLFVDITWSKRNDPGNLLKLNSSTAIFVATKEIFGPERTMLHICCNGYTKEQNIAHLEQALDNGIRNVMALRGDDEPETAAENGTNDEPSTQKHFHAIDLVKWTRELEQQKRCNGNGLTVAVAGHLHPPDKAITYGQCLAHLKAKVEAGADFVTTQFFLDVQQFEQFLADCRSVGIKVPILPGILLFKSAICLRKIAAMANVPIPEKITQVLDANRGDTVAIQNFSVQLAVDMCRKLLGSGITAGIHIFTLNQREMCNKLLQQLGFWPTLAVEPAMNGIVHDKVANGKWIPTLNGHKELYENALILANGTIRQDSGFDEPEKHGEKDTPETCKQLPPDDPMARKYRRAAELRQFS